MNLKEQFDEAISFNVNRGLIHEDRWEDLIDALIQAVEASLPPEFPVKYMNVRDMDGNIKDKLPMLAAEKQGYNAAIADMKDKLK